MNLIEFLDRVVAPGNWLAIAYLGDWPSPAHRFFPRDDVRAAARFLTWATDKRWETWYALASYQHAERTKDGKKDIGPRKQENVDKLKAFWLDADISRPGDGKKSTSVFANEREVLLWIKGFIDATGIPCPNLWVKSGYGMHIYWTIEDALDRSAWQPHAEALKGALIAHGSRGDLAVVADAARILRPIGTWNYKVPDNPVAVYEYQPDRLTRPDYPNNLMLDALGKLSGHKTILSALPARTPSTTGSGGSLAAARSGMAQPLRDFARISAECLQASATLASGGAGDGRPLWWALINLTTFCEDGRGWAHKLGEKDPRYTQAETDREYDRAVDDRARKPDLGAPLCKTFDAARQGVCQACPHYQSATVTSPWHLGGPASLIEELPFGFRQGSDEWIERPHEKDPDKWVRVVGGTFSNLILDELDGGLLRLTFTYSTPGANKRAYTIAVRNDEFGNDDGITLRFAAKHGIHVMPDCGRYVRKLLMAWIDKLNRACRVRRDPPPTFGWFKNATGYRGFATGGTCYATGGGEETVRGDDSGLLQRYRATGKLAEWQAAAQFIASNVPELHTAIAASFGAPLMEFTGEPAAAVSFIGKSGTGKSSAFKAGSSVWGRPLSTMLQLDDTATYQFLTMGEVKALPVYWDEIKVSDPDQLISTLHKLTQGRDKGRGTSDIKVRTPGEWGTLCSLSANSSIADIISDKMGYNDPTFLRLLEIDIARDAPKYNSAAGLIVQKLDRNYGVAGQLYARHLADNVPRITADIENAKTKLAIRTSANDSSERFYVAIAAAILVGAVEAKRLGIIDLDLAGIRDVLCNAIVGSRKMRHSFTPPTPNERLGKILDAFLSELGQDKVVTHRLIKPGPRAKNTTPPPLVQPNYRMQSGSVPYQISVDDRLLRISKDHWQLWCRKKGHAPNGLFSEMSKLWGMHEGRGMIGAGTIFAHKTYFYEVSLAHPDLLDHLDPYQTTTATTGSGNVVPIRGVP